MFAMGNTLFACGIRERSFGLARGETEVGKRRLLAQLAPEPSPLPPLALAPWTRTAGTQTESQLEPATYAGVILHETGQFLLLCSLQLWQQLQRCRQTVQEYHCCLIHFTSVLRKQFAANDMFLREANSYKRALALRNSRLPSDASILQLVWAPRVGSGSECHIDSYVWPNIVMKQNTNC